MKKKVLAAVMAAALAFSMAACGNSETPKDDPAPSAGSEAPAPAPTDQSASAGTEGEIRTTGPNGEQGVNANTINLSDEQIAQIKDGGYKVAICMHYGGNDWATAQINGIKDTCAQLGMEVIAVTDANFSAEQQVSDIETVLALKPDVIISIPVDATASADAYMQASKAGVKIVFMDNVAAGMTAGEDYVSCVSADGYGNGCVAAELIGEKLGGEGEVAMVYYDADFFATNLRDQGFKETMAAKFPNIKIVSEQGFTDENGCNEQADAILTQYPNIDGIYASWDIPMEGVLSSVRASGMEGKIALATIDLGNNMALEIAKGAVLGVGAQLPYDQGVAETKLAALSLLGESTPAFVVCPALRVETANVCDAYETVYHIDAPDWLTEAAK